MRVSEYYDLHKTQAELDFVDVDIKNDIRLFVDPRAIAQLPGEWAASCVTSIQSFFQQVLDSIASGDDHRAIYLLSHLREPNETHLGLSKGESNGNALGDKLAEEFWAALSSSKAVVTGLIQDLEDTALMVENVGRDRISDITTNLIRRQLIDYTQETCDFHGIALISDVPSGSIWDTETGDWREEPTSLPVPDGKKLLLIPKEIIRRELHMNSHDYYTHKVLGFLWAEEDAAGGLAKVVRGRTVTLRADVNAKYKSRFARGTNFRGAEKRINSWASGRNPELLSNYKEFKENTPSRIPANDEIAAVTGARDNASIDDLMQRVLQTSPGKEEADLYERRVADFLTALLYPHLVHPRRQKRIHSDRKRIDIAYTNAATNGFFFWLGMHYPAATITVECKNYSRPVGNPELDQLQGRFSPSRGKVGLLVYRGYVDKEKIWQSCLDTAHDGRGYIIPLDDSDLEELVSELHEPPDTEAFGYLHRLFSRLTDN